MQNPIVEFIINVILSNIISFLYNQYGNKIITIIIKNIINMIIKHLSLFDSLNKYLKIFKDRKKINGYYNKSTGKYELSKEYIKIRNFLKLHNLFQKYKTNKIINKCKIIINKIIIINIKNKNINNEIISTIDINCMTNKINIDHFLKYIHLIKLKN